MVVRENSPSTLAASAQPFCQLLSAPSETNAALADGCALSVPLGILLISESPVQNAGGCRRGRSCTSPLRHRARCRGRGGCIYNPCRKARRGTSQCLSF